MQNPHALLELYDGLLVRFTCDEEVWRIEETTWEEQKDPTKDSESVEPSGLVSQE